MALSPGTRLGHYDVTALIGEGGMGQVWQATDTQLNRQVGVGKGPSDAGPAQRKALTAVPADRSPGHAHPCAFSGPIQCRRVEPVATSA